MKRTVTAVLLVSALLAASAEAQVTSPSGPASVGTGSALTVTSLSTIRLSFDPLTESRPGASYLLSQAPVGASTYQPGSSRLGDQPLPDPVVGEGGTLYWLLSPEAIRQAQGAGGSVTLSYQVTHVAPLPPLPAVGVLSRVNAGPWERVSGQLNLGDYALARPLPAQSPVENSGNIKLPLANTQLRQADQISVVVEVPAGSSLTPSVNGEPVAASKLGESSLSADGTVERRKYYAVNIRPGINTITLGDEQLQVKYAGVTTTYLVEPVSLVADGSTPVRLKITAQDANGFPTEQPYVTVQTNLQPVRPDARPTEIGYQVALKDGVGLLELQPQTTPVTLTLDLWRNEQRIRQAFDVQAGRNAVGAGMLSATVGLDPQHWQESAQVEARAYYEGPIGPGKLYVAADRRGLPASDAANLRNLSYGDSSFQSVPLQGHDPLAFVYEHPKFSVAYRQGELPISAVPVSGQLTALTGSTKGNVRLSGFAAFLPADLVREQELTPEGTRLLHLGRENIAPDSETLTVVVTDRATGTEVERRTLTRNQDYTLDAQTGVVTLATALHRVNADLNDVKVLATYRLFSGDQNRRLAYGAQLETGTEQARIGVAAVQVDGVTTLGVSGHYAPEGNRFGVVADARLLYAGDIRAEGRARMATGGTSANFSASYQGRNYRGLGEQGSGTRVKGELSQKVTERVTAQVTGSYVQTQSSEQGEVSAQALYTFKPLVVGAGARYSFGDRSGVSLIGSAGYDNGRLNALVSHAQPVSGDVSPETDFKVSYPLRPGLKLGFDDHYDWNSGHTATVSLESTVGRTTYNVAYELPNASGAGNRARFGVATSLPLTARTTLGVRAAYIRDLVANTNEGSASADLTYRADHYVASLGTDVKYDAGITTVIRTGLSGDLSPEMNVSADGTWQLGRSPGAKIGVGYAYRGSAFSSLGYLRYADGSLGGSAPSVSAGASAEYRQPKFSVRAGADLRMLLQDRDSLTYQPYLGLSAQVIERVRVGAWGRALIQPSTGTALSGYGVEAGFRALPGTWLTAGYNIRGFSGLDTAGMYTRPGAYVRLDLTLDETLNGAKK